MDSNHRGGAVLPTSGARLLIADDHQMLAQAMGLALVDAGFAPVCVVDPATLDQIRLEADRFEPDVAVLDLHLGNDQKALVAMEELAGRGVLVLAITGSSDPVEMGQCLAAGAIGVLEKSRSWDVLIQSIVDLVDGQSIMRPSAQQALLDLVDQRRRADKEWSALFAQLTPREREVLSLLRQGLVAGEIARSQDLSLPTVRTHISAVLRKLGVSSQIAAVAMANRGPH